MGPGGVIPKDKLPQCWVDDVRMNALFAPFRLKAANPESWEMKMKFWSDLLRQWCRSRGDSVVSAADAKVAFQRNGRTPACIDIVIEEMFRNGDLVPLSKYQQILHNGPEGWVKWGARLAFKPASIAMMAVTSLLPARQALDNDGLPKASIDSTQKFVLESVLKEQASGVIDSYPPGLERVGTIDEIMSRCKWSAGRDAFEMALGCLVEAGRATLKGDVVKLAEANHKVSPITETDEAIVKLTTAESRLASDATRLWRDHDVAQADAKAALALGNKVAAKNHLRKKLKASQRLDRCTAALENVRHLLQQMTEVAQNKNIVDTYKTAAEAMKQNIKVNNMDEDTVHDTMDDLKEVMESYGEIERVLTGTFDDDTADLEAELKELLATPADGNGNTQDAKKTPKPPRKISEREFVFDGEQRVLDELNSLGVEETTLSPAKDSPTKPLAEASPSQVAETPKKKPVAAKAESSKPWYPPSSEWNNNFAEIRLDDRLHPGQPLKIDFTSPPRLYNHEFQVKDHKMDGGVWLFNKDGDTSVDDLVGTEYCSSESPGKTGSNFQMAPGGERKRDPKNDQADDLINLEQRLKNLRGLRVETPHRKGAPSQCHNCQLYGHSARNCFASPRCVKCREDHGTTDCKRTRDTIEPPGCVLCGAEGYTANYRGCPKAPKASRKATQWPPRTPQYSKTTPKVDLVPSRAPTTSKWSQPPPYSSLAPKANAAPPKPQEAPKAPLYKAPHPQPKATPYVAPRPPPATASTRGTPIRPLHCDDLFAFCDEARAAVTTMDRLTVISSHRNAVPYLNATDPNFLATLW